MLVSHLYLVSIFPLSFSWLHRPHCCSGPPSTDLEDADTVVGGTADEAAAEAIGIAIEEAAKDADGAAADEAAKGAAEDAAAGAAKASGEAPAKGASSGPTGEAGKASPRRGWWATNLPPPQPRAPADI